jgi:nitrite reductase/ring-hydroxylating ferredoxin subunit
LAHGTFSLIQFHALGDTNPIVSLLVSNTRFRSVADFPFELLGVAALGILFLMAATSHDFWLHLLSPEMWKRMHMSAYLAYGLLIAHVCLGALQSETSPLLAAALLFGFGGLSLLHFVAGTGERRMDHNERPTASDGFAEVCSFDSIPESRAKVVTLGGERIAVFKHQGKVSALSNVCRHQNGPLGEGRIVDGCVTCPWHGYQYNPDTGVSPPPYDDRVTVFATRIVDGTVWVQACPK